MSYVHFLEVSGWVGTPLLGRVPPGLKEFFILPFLVLNARHPANTMHYVCSMYRNYGLILEVIVNTTKVIHKNYLITQTN